MKSCNSILDFYCNKLFTLTILLLILSSKNSYKLTNFKPYYKIINLSENEYTMTINKLILSNNPNCSTSINCNKFSFLHSSRHYLKNNVDLVLSANFSEENVEKIMEIKLKHNSSFKLLNHLIKNDPCKKKIIFEKLSSEIFGNHYNFLYNLYTFKDFYNIIENSYRIEFHKLSQKKNCVQKLNKLTDSLEKLKYLFHATDLAIKNAYKNSKPIKLVNKQKYLFSYIDNFEEVRLDIQFAKENFTDKILILNIPLEIKSRISCKDNIYLSAAVKNYYSIHFKFKSYNLCKAYKIDNENSYLKPFSMYKIIRTIKFRKILIVVADCMEDNLEILKSTPENNIIKGLHKFLF